jgi:hypothetical protein
VFPPLLVRALRVEVEDTNLEWHAAVLNEIQAIAPRHLNPAIDAPDAVQRPARGYILPLYNASDAWRPPPSRCDDKCHAHSQHALNADDESQGTGHERHTAKPWFAWEGALAHNESIVQGVLRGRVTVHNFDVPAQGQLELYVQHTRAASTNEHNSLKMSVAELAWGLHVLTARLRGLDGEWLPYSDRRVIFVGARPPIHPWLLAHEIQVVATGYYISCRLSWVHIPVRDINHLFVFFKYR